MHSFMNNYEVDTCSASPRRRKQVLAGTPCLPPMAPVTLRVAPNHETLWADENNVVDPKSTCEMRDDSSFWSDREKQTTVFCDMGKYVKIHESHIKTFQSLPTIHSICGWFELPGHSVPQNKNTYHFTLDRKSLPRPALDDNVILNQPQHQYRSYLYIFSPWGIFWCTQMRGWQ